MLRNKNKKILRFTAVEPSKIGRSLLFSTAGIPFIQIVTSLMQDNLRFLCLTRFLAAEAVKCAGTKLDS